MDERIFKLENTEKYMIDLFTFYFAQLDSADTMMNFLQNFILRKIYNFLSLVESHLITLDYT